MKKIQLALIAMIVITTTANSQTSIERINIKGGSSAWDNFYKEIYRYPGFQTGIVEYKNGKRSKGSLNYNKVLGTIQFISEKGDTLSLSEEETIAKVTIDNDVFYYSPYAEPPTCLQEVKAAPKLKLVKSERLRIADKQKIGGLGIANSTGTIESIDRLDTKANYNQVDINENLLLSKTTNFYLETSRKDLVPASRKNVLSLFPKHENAIREYIKAKQIDFTKEDDLAALTDYLSLL